MTCQHSLAEKEAACADGMCPICAAARAELAQIEVARLIEQCRGMAQSAMNNGQALLLAEAEVEQLKKRLNLAEDWNRDRLAENMRLKSRIFTLEGMLGEANIAVPNEKI
jgi:hypothetical protein